MMTQQSADHAAVNPHTLALFSSASTEYQTLVRAILSEERDVMLMKRRSDIHQRLVDHVKRVIK